MPAFRVLAALGLLLTASLGGCGFQPVYGGAGRNSAFAQFAEINVPVLPDRPGQLLRQALQQRLEGSGAGRRKRYDLKVTFSLSSDQIGVQTDSTTTRVRQSATATWTLVSLEPGGSVVTNGLARAIDGSNIINQQYFAADIAQDTVQQRLLSQIADQITLQLGEYFKQHSQPG